MLVYQRVPSQIIGVTADLPQHVSATGLCGYVVWIRLDIYIYIIILYYKIIYYVSYNISIYYIISYHIILYYNILYYILLYYIILK